MYLFFVRRNNDVDHIAPVVHAIASRGAPAMVLCQDPLHDIGTDFRLQYLQREHRVLVDYVYRIHMPTLRHRLAGAAMCASIGRRGARGAVARRAAGAYARVVAGPLFTYAEPALYDADWACALMKTTGAVALAFDHNPPTRYVSGALLEAARRLRIPTAALPHGTHMLVNELRAQTRESAGRIGRVQIFDPYDRVVTMEPLHAAFLRRMGVPREKLVLLGSARYCQEWREVIDRIRPPRVLPPVDVQGRLKLVYMDKQARRGVHQALLEQEIARIAARPDVCLVIKPETRTHTMSSAPLGRVAHVASDIDSADLIKWADAVLVSHSSIAIEVLQQGKTLLHARYFHENMAMFDEMGACWTLAGPAEFDAAIDTLVADRTARPYLQANVDRFLTQVVDGGRPGRSTLAEYADFLASLEGAPAVGAPSAGAHVSTP